MAYVTATRPGRYEIRESHSTSRGPRARTLASFDELTDEVIEKAQRRATKPVEAEDLRHAARRVGAPIARPPADRAARELLSQLAMGRGPAPRLRRLLDEMLHDDSARAAGPKDPGRAVAEWMAATPEQRGRTLVDLLLLADALPHGGRRGKPLKFPRLATAN
jgi:hypothetical protein